MRTAILNQQGNKCWLCDIDLSGVTACLDHDHVTGALRGVLCNNCNGIEGKIFNLARRAKRQKTELDFISYIISYWVYFKQNPRDIIHPTHRTKEEKRIRRNKLARERRKRLT